MAKIVIKNLKFMDENGNEIRPITTEEAEQLLSYLCENAFDTDWLYEWLEEKAGKEANYLGFDSQCYTNPHPEIGLPSMFNRGK